MFFAIYNLFNIFLNYTTHCNLNGCQTKVPIMQKFLKIAAVILLVIIAAGSVYIRHISRKALPDYNADTQLSEMKGEVTVLRNQQGVPSVYAKNEADLYRAVGYVMAQDRLWQMDLLRRVTTGSLSEIFGKDFINTDLLMRSLRIPEKSSEILRQSDSSVVAALEAFSCGVNQFISNNSGNLPPEFSILGYTPDRWKPEHSVNLTGYMAWDLNMGWSTEVILHKLRQELDEEMFHELIPDLSLQDSYIYPDFTLEGSGILSVAGRSARLQELGVQIFSGSNNWAVSGEKSATGSPLLSNDMHLGLMAPGIWYQMHHVVEDELNVTGVVLPGQPFVVAGHNENIAWGMTNVMLDDVDFYLETVNPEDPHQYRYMEEWRDMEVRSEVIKTGSKDSVIRELLFTHRGPVISDFKGVRDQAISMKWTGNLFSNEVRSVYLLNRAENWDQFRDALTTFNSVSQNVVYADTDGNIGLQTAAGIPLREGSGILIVPGEVDTYDWQGIVPFEELPFVYNPPEGFVLSANNRTVPDDYPYYISHWYDLPYRYDRIREMLTEKEVLSADDFRDMLTDNKSKLAEEMVPGLLDELSKVPQLSPSENEAVSLLKDWDMVYCPSEAAPLIFEQFYIQFIETLLREQMGDDLYREFIASKVLVRNIINRVWTKRESVWLQERFEGGGDPFTKAVHKSFSSAVGQLEEKLGGDLSRWAWGELHTFTVEHPVGSVWIIDLFFNMNRGPFQPGGSFHTVCPYSYDYGNPFVVNHGASQRHIFSAADWDESLVVIPTGTSGIPASRYYCDQTETYTKGGFYPSYFSRRQVEENAKYRMKIIPR